MTAQRGDDRRRELDVRLMVADYGPWQPDDLGRAAEVIAVVNEHRRELDGKPRVESWGGERTLVATIEATTFSLAPGEHLVRMTFPDGSDSWGGIQTDLLAKLEASS